MNHCVRSSQRVFESRVVVVILGFLRLAVVVIVVVIVVVVLGPPSAYAASTVSPYAPAVASATLVAMRLR